MDYTIYALKGNSDFDIFSSLSNGEGRFGWSYIETADLRKLSQRIGTNGWDNLSDEEQNCYQAFLLDFRDGDYVVYINVPEWGQCTIAQVTGEYRWEYTDPDFNHRFPVAPESIKVFNRNDAAVHPALRSRLKLQGRWWRIYATEEFAALLAELKHDFTPIPRQEKSNYRFLACEIQPHLASITQCIHHTHPNYDLESLLAEVFKQVPNVIDVRLQGGAEDHGADIVVTFEEGLPVPGLGRQSILVVQVKSYQGEHWHSQAVDDIRRAFEHYPEAGSGLIISTADTVSENLERSLDKLREESKKPVSLLVGADVATFILRYGAKLLT